MTPAARLGLLAVALAVLVPAGWHCAAALPAFGVPASEYGETVNALLPSLRHVANMVAAVNFDVRGVDTLGEECMLVCAVTGVTVLLRGARGESASAKAGIVPGRPEEPRADATTLVCRIGAGMTMLFGAYVVVHGTVTPGGGFQGGVIAASGLLLVYLGEGYGVSRAMIRPAVLAVLEGGGASIFVLAAALPLLAGREALTNILPLGTYKDPFSGGMMVVVNLAVAASVSGSFGLMLSEFLEETRSPADDPVPDEQDR